MPFSVTILGANSATPTPSRHPSAQLVNIRDNYMLVDCGEGTQMQLMRFHLKFNRIQYIFISHLHGDHFLGLPGLLSTMSHLGRKNPIQIFGPPGLKKFLDLVWDLNEHPIGFTVDIIETQDSQEQWILQHKLFRVKSFPLKHRVPTTGFYFEELKPLRHINVQECRKNAVPTEYYPNLQLGEDYATADGILIPNSELTLNSHKPRRFVYCSDTAFYPKITEWVQDVDLIYHEATFMNELHNRAQETGHSTAAEAAQIAKLCKAQKLLLGHYSSRYRELAPLLEEARSVFEASYLAQEGETYHIERIVEEELIASA